MRKLTKQLARLVKAFNIQPHNQVKIEELESRMMLSAALINVNGGQVLENATSNTTVGFHVYSQTVDNAVATTVQFAITGTALRGTDYVLKDAEGNVVTGTSLTLAAGEYDTWLYVVPKDNTKVNADKTAILTLTSSNNANYEIDSQAASGTVTILDNEPTISIAATTAITAEGTDTPGVFRITRNYTDAATTISFSLNGSTAGRASNQDYILKDGNNVTIVGNTITMAAGVDNVTIKVVPINDAIAEQSETVVLTLENSSANSYQVNSGASSATVTILDNEPTVGVEVDTATMAENDGDGAVFTISRDNTDLAITVNFTLSGSATRNTDYVVKDSHGNTLGRNTSITMAAGVSSVTLTVLPTDDATVEPTEAVILTLASSNAYKIDGQAASATTSITDNEPTVGVVVDTATMAENDGDGAVFTISRDKTDLAITVNFKLTGSATRNTDYVVKDSHGNTLSSNTSITMAAGVSSVTLTVLPLEDKLAESTEAVILTLADNSNTYRIDSQTASATTSITDNEPTISVAAAVQSTTEGGNTNGLFEITRTDTTNAITVSFQLSGTASRSGDYVLKDANGNTISGNSVVMAAGVNKVQITVVPVNDALAEQNETAILTISSNSAYKINDAAKSATVTIVDNEPTVGVEVDTATMAESDGDGAVFTISRDNTDLAITVNFTLAGSATRNKDYVVKDSLGNTINGNSITMAAGVSSVTLTVLPTDDALVEPTEVIVLALSSSNAYKIDSQAANASTSITDNEPTVGVEVDTATMAENDGDGAVFTISRDKSDSAVTVNFKLTGSATRNTDYVVKDSLGNTITGNTITMAAGVSSVTLTVLPTDDALVEPTEAVILTLADNSNTYRIDSQATSATTSITDNEPTIGITAKTATTTEGSSTPAEFVISRDNTEKEITVYFGVSGTATISKDYVVKDKDGNTITGNIIKMAAGVDKVSLFIAPVDDALAESTESVIVTLTAKPTIYTLNNAAKTATVTIADNEQIVNVDHVGTLTVNEGDTDGLTFTIERDKTTGSAVVNFGLSGSAIRGKDYLLKDSNGNTISGNTVTFAAGQDTITLKVVPIDDLLLETTETVIFTLNKSDAYNLGDSSLTMYISDNEPELSVAATDSSTSESDTTGGIFTVFRNSTVNALTVTFTLSGTATRGSDYLIKDAQGNTITGNSITMAAGVGSVVLYVVAVNDSIIEPDETVTLKLTASSTNPSYSIDEDATSALITIADNEATLSLTADGGQGYGYSKNSSDNSTLAADLNGDGKLDLVSYNSTGYTVYLGDKSGNGTYSASFNYSIAGNQQNITSILARDINADGNLDLIAIEDSEDGSLIVDVMLNKGNGRFVDPVKYDLLDSGSPTVSYAGDDGLVITDLNKDGKLDIAVAATVAVVDDTDPQNPITHYVNTLFTMLGTSDGLFAEPTSYVIEDIGDADANGTQIYNFNATDINGDGRPDLIIGYETWDQQDESDWSAKFGVLLSKNTGGYQASPTIYTLYSNSGAERDMWGYDYLVADINKDGKTDLGMYSIYSTSVDNVDTYNIELSLLTGKADGTFNDASTITIAEDTDSQSVASELRVADVNNDGALDLVAISVLDDAPFVMVALNNGSGAFLAPSYYALTSNAYEITLADVNGDNRLDIIAGGKSFSQQNQAAIDVLINNGNGTFADSVYYSNDNLGASVDEITVVDLNSDGKKDIVINGYNSESLVTMINNGDGTFATQVNASEINGSQAGAVTFTITRTSGDSSNALAVTYALTPAITASSADYTLTYLDGSLVGQTVGRTIILDAGKQSVSLKLTPKTDALAENTETVRLVLTAGANYLLDPSAKGLYVAVADAAPTISIEASDDSAAETAPGAQINNGSFVITRSLSSVAATVNFTVGGSAIRGTDYVLKIGNDILSGNSVTFTEGGDDEILITVVPIADDLMESSETVTLTIASSNSLYNTSILGNSATVTIANLAVPIISMSTTDAVASETSSANSGGLFTLTRTGGDLSQSLTVDYAISGTATNGDDYSELSGKVTFAAGVSTATIAITPIDDLITESSQETVIVTLLASEDGSYKITNTTANQSGSVTLADNDIAPDAFVGAVATVSNASTDTQTQTVTNSTFTLYYGEDKCVQVKSTGEVDTCTYLFEKTGNNTVKLTLDWSNDRDIILLTFTSATTATFTATSYDLSGEEPVVESTATGNCTLELAATGFAPESIVGAQVVTTVTNSVDPDEIDSQSTITFGQDTQVSIDGDGTVAKSYSYVKYAPNFGFMQTGNATSLLLFTTATTGSFYYHNADNGFYDSGTMTMTSVTNAPESLDGTELYLQGSSSAVPGGFTTMYNPTFYFSNADVMQVNSNEQLVQVPSQGPILYAEYTSERVGQNQVNVVIAWPDHSFDRISIVYSASGAGAYLMSRFDSDSNLIAQGSGVMGYNTTTGSYGLESLNGYILTATATYTKDGGNVINDTPTELTFAAEDVIVDEGEGANSESYTYTLDGPNYGFVNIGSTHMLMEYTSATTANYWTYDTSTGYYEAGTLTIAPVV